MAEVAIEFASEGVAFEFRVENGDLEVASELCEVLESFEPGFLFDWSTASAVPAVATEFTGDRVVVLCDDSLLMERVTHGWGDFRFLGQKMKQPSLHV